jgi:hypothetical protein
MALQVAPAWCLGHALLLGSLTKREKNFSRIWLLLAFGLFVTAATVWFTPQKRITSIILGHLHGPVYDHWIPVHSDVLWQRGLHFLVGAACCIAFLTLRVRKILLGTAALIFLGSLIYGALSPSLQNGRYALDLLMPVTQKGPSYLMHGTSKSALEDLQPQVAFHLQDIRRLFNLTSERVVHVYVYPSEDEKKVWFGGGGTDITDVVTPSIHITSAPWPHPTLRHELVHAVASEFHWLGFNPNMAFTEGLATAIAPQESALTYDESTASLLKSGRIPTLESLFNPWTFWQVSGARAYTVAASFTSYLLNQFAPEVVKKLYGGSTDVGRLKNAVDQWTAHVKRSFNPDSEIQAESLYRSGGVFQTLCPHTRADYSRPPGWNVEWRQPIGWTSKEYPRWLPNLVVASKSSDLRLWRTNAADIVRSQPTRSALDSLIKTVSDAKSWPPKQIEDVELAILESDLMRARGQRHESLALLQNILEMLREKPAGDGMLRQTLARIHVETRLASEPAREWRYFLSGWSSLPQERLNGQEPWIVTYLILRQSYQKASSEELAFFKSYIFDNTLPPTFAYEWFKLLALGYERLGDPLSASDMMQGAMTFARSGQKKWLETLQSELNYRSSNAPHH